MMFMLLTGVTREFKFIAIITKCTIKAVQLSVCHAINLPETANINTLSVKCSSSVYFKFINAEFIFASACIWQQLKAMSGQHNTYHQTKAHRLEY